MLFLLTYDETRAVPYSVGARRKDAFLHECVELLDEFGRERDGNGLALGVCAHVYTYAIQLYKISGGRRRHLLCLIAVRS